VACRHIDAMLKNKRDQLPLQEVTSAPAVGTHENLRGSSYYQ